MKRGLFSLLFLAGIFGMASVAQAHHPAKMERCESFAFTGQVERIVWQRPHVELFIRTDAGVSHQVTWLAINQLGVAGIDQNTLKIGDQVVVIAGVRPNDIVERPMLLSYIHRDSDGWGWTERPQGC